MKSMNSSRPGSNPWKRKPGMAAFLYLALHHSHGGQGMDPPKPDKENYVALYPCLEGSIVRS